MTAAGDLHRAWRNLPFGQLDDIIGPGTCLIVAPHPDDESLGCGGLIARCVAAGRSPLVVILTDGAGSHPNSRAFPPDRLRAVRADEVRTAVGHLGLSTDRVVFLGEPDTAAPHRGPDFDRVVSRLVALIRQEPHCTAVLAPWRHDPHCDHEAASLAAKAVITTLGIRRTGAGTNASAPRRAAMPPAIVRHIAYPVWGWTLPSEAFVPNSDIAGWRLDISDVRSAKGAAIEAHRSQYGNLITDDPEGFRLPRNLLSVFDSDYEIFFQT